MRYALGLWTIMFLVTIDASAASTRSGVSSCSYASCLGPTPSRSDRRGSAYKLRHKTEQRSRSDIGLNGETQRKRRNDDAVSRLQNKIAREQAKRKLGNEGDIAGYRYPELNSRSTGSLDCREGRLLLQGLGYYRVSPIRCQGRIFTYLARENGDTVRILVDSRYGRVISNNH